MPSIPAMPRLQPIGRDANPLFTSFLALPVPIVPIIHLLNVVCNEKRIDRHVMGAYMRVKSWEDLGTNIGTGGFMREKVTEQKLVRAAKLAGGLALKFASPGFDGVPDRLVLLPGSKIAFVEVKAHGMTPRPLQKKRHEMLRRLGFKVYVLDDPEQIGGILIEIQSS